jgi:micrococcal nuclease
MRVVDGDTFDVVVDGGATERVRLIGVDTPETFVSMGNPHCYGADAKLFTEDLTGRRVALTFDRDCDDDNMRTLAYAWLGPRENDLWQRQLLRRGYARLLIIGPDDGMSGTFAADEAIARAEERGLWLECQ